jgi:hypothetical protein
MAAGQPKTVLATLDQDDARRSAPRTTRVASVAISSRICDSGLFCSAARLTLSIVATSGRDSRLSPLVASVTGKGTNVLLSCPSGGLGQA